MPAVAVRPGRPPALAGVSPAGDDPSIGKPMIVHGVVVACRGLAADGLKGPVDRIPGEIRREGGNRAPLCDASNYAK